MIETLLPKAAFEQNLPYDDLKKFKMIELYNILKNVNFNHFLHNRYADSNRPRKGWITISENNNK